MPKSNFLILLLNGTINYFKYLFKCDPTILDNKLIKSNKYIKISNAESNTLSLFDINAFLNGLINFGSISITFSVAPYIVIYTYNI